MAKIKLNGDTSGYIEISAPAVSGNNTLELGPGTKILTNLDNTFTGITTFSNGIHITSGGFILNQQRSNTHASLIIDKPDAGTGTLKFFNNGSASAYIQHTNSEHLNYYLPSGSGSQVFYTNGTEKLRILSSGQVVIGESTNYANANADDLIVGNRSNNESGITIGSSNQGQIAFADSGADRAGLIHYQHTDNSMRFYTNGPTNERLRITSAGWVGINCTPFAQFHVKTGTNANISMSTMSSEASIEAYNDAGSANVPLRLRGSDLKFFTSSTERLRVTNDGNIGIGTDTPYVNNSFNSLSIGGSGNYGLIELNRSDGVAGSWIDVYGTNGNGDLRITTAGTSGAITFWTGGSFTEKLRITSDGNVLVGNTTSASTASPVNLSLGATFSNSGGQNPKLSIWEDSAGDYMSLGVSSNQLDFMMSRDDYDFVWYGQNDSNNGPEERMRLDNSEKLFDFAGTCKIRVKGSNNPGTTHAHLNIGSDGGGSTDTRAIDIWGNWSNQESKSITWSHGTTSTSDMVCQQRVRYNSSPSTTVYEIGRFFNGQNTTAFPFQLQSTSTTTADLTIDGNVLHKTAAFVARSTQNNNISSTTRAKIDYTVDYSYQSVFNNTNDRFTCTKAGLYFFYARHWFASNSTGTIYMDWLKNGSLVKEFRVTHPYSNGEYETIQGSGMIYMAVNDYLEVYGRSDGSGVFHESNGATYSEFSGFYVSGG